MQQTRRKERVDKEEMRGRKMDREKERGKRRVV